MARSSARFATLCFMVACDLFAQCPTGNPPIVTVTSGATSAQATNCLQTSGTVTINSSSTVFFQAGAAVHLLPGFTAQAGSSGTAFIAQIAPVITTTSLPSGTPNTAYSAGVSATEGASNGPFTWLVTQGSLPPNLGLAPGAIGGIPAGVISGTPTALGTFGFSVTATDSAGHSSIPQALSITVDSGQSITFAPLGNLPYGAAPFTVSATASSGLPVSFASAPATVCTISGNTVTLMGVGTCTVTASQGGNATYAAATPVPQSFSVTADTTGSVVYTYDSQGRLATATYTSPGSSVTVTYSYDAAGNRTAVVAQ